MIYTGIGSRQTPWPILDLMTRLGAALATRGRLLRSGGSPGADSAFERGCDEAAGRKEIYLPWKGFNGSDSPLAETPAGAMEIALRVHPGLRTRSWAIRQLRARNVCQILGPSLDRPSNLVIAWTPGGVASGGSATVLKIAQEARIPVLNLGAAEFTNTRYAAVLSRILAVEDRAAGGAVST